MEISIDLKNKRNLREGVWKLLEYGIKDNTDNWQTIKTEEHSILLVLKNHCLMVICKDSLLECISLFTNNLRIVCKQDMLIIITEQENGKLKRTLRFQFAAIGLFTSKEVCIHCVDSLKDYIDVRNVFTDDSESDDDYLLDNRISVPQQVALLLNKDISSFYAENKHLMDMYPLEGIVDYCVADGTFPSLVAHVNEIITNKIKPK